MQPHVMSHPTIRRWRPQSLPSFWAALVLGITLVLAVPIVAVLTSLATPASDIWRHLWRTQLTELFLNTVRLLLGVGLGTLVLGTTLAWLVVYYRFPGRGLFEWALMLPLAMPAYVLGFVFLGVFDFTGPVQTLVRRLLGQGVRLPELRSFWGVTLMLTLVLYPYVYLLVRTAFREQGAAALETARSLGHTPWRAFLTVTVPLARPAVVAGVALAMMEALADFGTVATFGYRTLTEAIYRVWYGMFDRTAAMQLASVLLAFALLLLAIERFWRGQARFTSMPRRGPDIMPTPLAGWPAWMATGLCLTVLGLAFLLPLVQLLIWAYSAWRAGQFAPDFVALVTNTMWLAGTTSLGVCMLAVLFAYTRRLAPAPPIRLAGEVVSMGYALPGSVIAVGVLLPLAALDHMLAPFLAALFGRPVGMVLTGSAVGLMFAYVVRFLAVSLQTVQASLSKIPASLDDAARSLGVGVSGTLRRVHIPLMRGGLLTALILVFVEVMKEMPATLLLRPFGLNTLAVEVWQRTSEAMWQEAALPALTIVGAGIVPVFVAIRLSISRSKEPPSMAKPLL